MTMTMVEVPDQDFLEHALAAANEIGHEVAVQRHGIRLPIRPGEALDEVEDRWRRALEERAGSRDVWEELRRAMDGKLIQIPPVPLHCVPIPDHAVDLRDRFAGQAMTGLLAYAGRDRDTGEPDDLAMLARLAYQVADALLAARGEG